MDFVSEEAEIAGKSAAQYIKGETEDAVDVNIKTDGKIRYTVPQKITKDKDITVFFRVADVYKNVKVNVVKNGEKVYSKKKIKVAPGEMESVKLTKDMFAGADELSFELEVL